jgi:peptide/nickel transport system substrate-binding protein
VSKPGRTTVPLQAMASGLALMLVLSCCSGLPAEKADGPTPDTSTVHNESSVPGGTVTFANPGEWDSLDPANTYYVYAWNFARLYGRSLVMFKSAPGAEGATLVPDLAESLGTPNADATRWTYRLRSGVEFENGTPVTSRDVKYAVERSLDKAVFPNGPTYFNDFLDLQGYTSPYTDPSPDRLGLTAIDTPDDRTIVFKLRKPFSGFDYLAQLPATIPVPRDQDTGSAYQQHVISTGPYMFGSIEAGKSIALVRNPRWDRTTDPNRAALPDRLEVALNVNADDIDNRLLAGDLDVAIDGSGVQPAAQGRILLDPALKANTDSAPGARTFYTVLNTDVVPLNNLHCRKAVLLAADRTAYQRANGGDLAGDIATNLIPPVIPGATPFDLYESTGDQGDVGKARDELRMCGRPDGFSTNISYRAEIPREKATAEALQQSLRRAGIAVEIKPFPLSDYLTLYAGKPDYARQNGLGLMITAWAADWPDGYGFVAQIVDSRVIRATGGNTNLGIRDKRVDQLLDDALRTTDVKVREKLWAGIDKIVMENAYILPGIWARGLLYRPPSLTNVFVTDGYGMYDYLALGTTR